MEFGWHQSDNIGTVVATTGTDGADPTYPISSSFPGNQPTAYKLSSAVQPDASAATFPSSANIAAPTVLVTTDSNNWATKKDWAERQADITRLYFDEKKPLKEVKRIMESHFGFRATDKMYKTHIKQWGLDKKKKELEMRYIVRKHKQRADQGKNSTIRVRGQVRAFAKVVRYWDRKGVSIDDLIARQTASPMPETVELSTPVPSPIQTPRVLAIPERIYCRIRDYFKGSFDSGIWYSTAPIFFCSSIKDDCDTFDMFDQFFSQCDLACKLFELYQFREAGQVLTTALAKIKKIIPAEPPLALREIYRLVFHMHCVLQLDELALIILRQFSAMSQVLLGSEHPLSQICEWTCSAYTSNLRDVLTTSMEVMADQYENLVGSMHFSTLDSRVEIIRLMTEEGRNRIQMLLNLLAEWKKTLRADDIRIMKIRHFIASECFSKGYYDEAKLLTQRNIAITQDPSSMAPNLYGLSWDLYCLAKCQYVMGEVHLGLATLHQTIDLIVSTWGPKHGRAGSWLLELEEWCLAQGLLDSAFQARERRLRMLELINVDD